MTCARAMLVAFVALAPVACGARANLDDDLACGCVVGDGGVPDGFSAGNVDAGGTQTDAGGAGDADGTSSDADGAALPILAAPRLIAPMSTSMSTSFTPLFGWVLSAGEDGAQIDICRDRACTTLVTTFSVLGTSAQSPVPLSQGVYYWRARGASGNRFGVATSAVWEVFVGPKNAAKVSSWGSVLDVNGDGFADVTIGASNVMGAAENVYLYLGAATGLSNAFTTWSYPTHPNGYYRDPIVSAGDVDGDGFPEVLVGTPDPIAKTGGALLYKGSAAGLAITTPVAIPPPPGIDSSFGWTIAGAGDIDGDGYADVIIGAPFVSVNGTKTGVFVYHGSASGLIGPRETLSTIQLPNNRTTILGRSFAAAGDVDGDGYADVIAAGNDGDYALLFKGSAAGLSTTPVLIETPHYPDQIGQSPDFGWSVACAGDVNADGYADLLIGAPGDGLGYNSTGSAYLYFGGPAALSVPMRLANPSANSGDGFGVVVAGGGDVDGDGYADIMAAADHGSYLYMGSPAGPAPQAIQLVVPGDGQNFLFGQAALAGAGDVDGDGFADLLTGSPDGNSYIGGAFLYLGSAKGAGAAIALPHPNTPSGFFGSSVQ